MRTGAIIGIFVLGAMIGAIVGGCSQNRVTVEVEEAEKQTGKNIASLRNEILEDARDAIGVWIAGEEAEVSSVFTENMMELWGQARALDREEGVRKVRVHEDQRFTIGDINDGVRPSVTYAFRDKSYFVDASSDAQVRTAEDAERTIIMFLVRDGERYKIDNMVGKENAIR